MRSSSRGKERTLTSVTEVLVNYVKANESRAIDDPSEGFILRDQHFTNCIAGCGNHFPNYSTAISIVTGDCLVPRSFLVATCGNRRICLTTLNRSRDSRIGRSRSKSSLP